MRKTESLELPESDDVNTVYADLISFVAALFILLFTMAYNKELDETYFEKMRIAMGGETITQQKRAVSEAVFVSRMQGYIREKKLSQYSMVLVDEQKIRIILNDPILFRPNRASLTKEGEQVMRGFVGLVKDVKNPIVIEGHTDDLPIRTELFEDNWELSMERAYYVLKFVLSTGLIKPDQISIKAFGQYKPLVPNIGPVQRAKNRRVEMTIIRVKKAE